MLIKQTILLVGLSMTINNKPKYQDHFALDECGYQVLDDLVNPVDRDNFEYTLTHDMFGWFLGDNDTTVDEYEYRKKLAEFPNIRESLQLSHHFCYPIDGKTQINSAQYDNAIVLFNNVIRHLDIYNLEIFRIKANLQIRCESNKKENHNTPHIDTPSMKHYVAIYYVIDSDGDTILFNEDNTEKARIAPKKGRFVVFDGDILHTGCHPIKNTKRIVLNYNFSIKQVPFQLVT